MKKAILVIKHLAFVVNCRLKPCLPKNQKVSLDLKEAYAQMV